jgi:ParB/RepB/Spo0J family partition protein
MDVEKLESLAASIRRYGIVLPLAVTPVADDAGAEAKADGPPPATGWPSAPTHFEIIDGHRRYVASGMVGLQEIPVNVFDSVEDAKFGIMLDTNVEREDITAAEEGIQFLQIAELRTWGIEDLMRHFGKSEDYINRRVRMVQEFPDVVTPVVERRINWSQASAIMRCPEKNYRAYMIEQADTHGASARTLTYMVDQWKSQAMIAAGGAAVHTPEHALPVVVAESPRCVFCTRDDDPSNIVQVPVHSYHRRDLETFLERTGINRPERSTAG